MPIKITGSYYPKNPDAVEPPLRAPMREFLDDEGRPWDHRHFQPEEFSTKLERRWRERHGLAPWEQC